MLNAESGTGWGTRAGRRATEGQASTGGEGSGGEGAGGQAKQRTGGCRKHTQEERNGGGDGAEGGTTLSVMHSEAWL